MSKKVKWNETSINKLIELRQQNYTWEKLTTVFPNMSANALRKAYYRYEGVEKISDPVVDALKKKVSAEKAKGVIAKQSQHILDYLAKRQDLISEVQDLINEVKFSRPVVIKPKVDLKKRKMIMEVMLTDLHYGKKTKTFDSTVARRRMNKYGDVVVAEYGRCSKSYNVEKIILFLGGDIIENATFHGVESRRASEFGNSEQVVLAIKSLYEDMFVKVASLGIPVEIVCVTGNHDRENEFKTFNTPGKENLTWIIYKALEQICQIAKLPHLQFEICEGIYIVKEVYGCPILYEHGDYMRGGLNRKSFESHMSSRSKQYGKLIKFGRFGHYHEKTMFGRGRIIVNASLPGQDDYAEINGYDSEASQTINFYVETKDRPDSFYHSFPVCLEDK